MKKYINLLRYLVKNFDNEYDDVIIHVLIKLLEIIIIVIYIYNSCGLDSRLLI